MDVGGDSGGNRGSPMKIERFEMERYQSTWENTVEFNLADRGGHPITLAALVDHSWIREVLAGEKRGYGKTIARMELGALSAVVYRPVGPWTVRWTPASPGATSCTTWARRDAGGGVLV